MAVPLKYATSRCVTSKWCVAIFGPRQHKSAHFPLSVMLFYLDCMDSHKCVFCGCFRRVKHFGNDCKVCEVCQEVLWKEHDKNNEGYIANFAESAQGVYAGAKKQRLSENSESTLMDEKCKAFTNYVVTRYNQLTAAQEAAMAQAGQAAVYEPMRGMCKMDKSKPY